MKIATSQMYLDRQTEKPVTKIFYLIELNEKILQKDASIKFNTKKVTKRGMNIGMNQIYNQ